MLPCFQLLRIGGNGGGDLYTFHPPSGAGCTYRLGHRADLCDVALRPQQEPGLISGVHAELHAERQGEDWRVSLEDHSSQGEQRAAVRSLPPKLLSGLMYRVVWTSVFPPHGVRSSLQLLFAGPV